MGWRDVNLKKIPFVSAHSSSFLVSNRKRGDILWIVIHTMESQEKGDTAESVARYFASPTRGHGGTRPTASAHYCIDSNSVVQCVQCKDQAAGAKGGNKKGIHLEHAGVASQTAARWDDTYSQEMLHISARLSGEILCPKYDIPVKWLSPADVKAGRRGFTSHANISKAFNISGGHWDPGPNFPVEEYLSWVRDALRS